MIIVVKVLKTFRFRCVFLALLTLVVPVICPATELADTVEKVKKSIVGVGSYRPVSAPQSRLFGTGFVVGNGHYVITNAHVVSFKLSVEKKEKLVVFVGSGRQSDYRDAQILAVDKNHDLALIRISGGRLPSLTIADSSAVREGEDYAFTGFPLGAVLGLYPATHQGIISSITPIATPMNDSRQLTPQLLKHLRDLYKVFQLDATAYPGSSGSPLYDKTSGQVIGVINSVFVKGTKEAAIKDPSGITYAIPAIFVKKIMEKIQ